MQIVTLREPLPSGPYSVYCAARVQLSYLGNNSLATWVAVRISGVRVRAEREPYLQRESFPNLFLILNAWSLWSVSDGGRLRATYRWPCEHPPSSPAGCSRRALEQRMNNSAFVTPCSARITRVILLKDIGLIVNSDCVRQTLFPHHHQWHDVRHSFLILCNR